MDFINPIKKYKNTDHLVYSCQYHVIFCPKYRRKILKDGIDVRLKEIFYEIAEQYDFNIIEMEVMPDHVHLLMECNPRLGIMSCIHKLKGISSHKLIREFSKIKRTIPTLWTRAAFVSTVGSVSLDVVKQYIQDQKGK